MKKKAPQSKSADPVPPLNAFKALAAKLVQTPKAKVEAKPLPYVLNRTKKPKRKPKPN